MTLKSFKHALIKASHCNNYLILQLMRQIRLKRKTRVWKAHIMRKSHVHSRFNFHKVSIYIPCLGIMVEKKGKKTTLYIPNICCKSPFSAIIPKQGSLLGCFHLCLISACYCTFTFTDASLREKKLIIEFFPVFTLFGGLICQMQKCK